MPNWTKRPVVSACAGGDESAVLGGGLVGEDELDVDRRVDSDRQRRLEPQPRPHPEGQERVQGKCEESRVNVFSTTHVAVYLESAIWIRWPVVHVQREIRRKYSQL